MHSTPINVCKLIRSICISISDIVPIDLTERIKVSLRPANVLEKKKMSVTTLVLLLLCLLWLEHATASLRIALFCESNTDFVDWRVSIDVISRSAESGNTSLRQLYMFEFDKIHCFMNRSIKHEMRPVRKLSVRVPNDIFDIEELSVMQIESYQRLPYYGVLAYNGESGFYSIGTYTPYDERGILEAVTSNTRIHAWYIGEYDLYNFVLIWVTDGAKLCGTNSFAVHTRYVPKYREDDDPFDTPLFSVCVSLLQTDMVMSFNGAFYLPNVVITDASTLVIYTIKGGHLYVGTWSLICSTYNRVTRIDNHFELPDNFCMRSISRLVEKSPDTMIIELSCNSTINSIYFNYDIKSNEGFVRGNVVGLSTLHQTPIYMTRHESMDFGTYDSLYVALTSPSYELMILQRKGDTYILGQEVLKMNHSNVVFSYPRIKKLVT